MQVTVNWTGNQDEWLAVKVRGFKTSEGRPIQTQPDVLEFYPSEGEVVKTVHFRVRTPGDDFCRYEIEYDRREPPETLTVEQIFLMRR